MPKPYSVDLRERVLNHLEKNADKKAASPLFPIGIAKVFRWVTSKKLKGNVEPLQRKYTYKKIDDQKLIQYIDDQKLIQYVETHPDHFLHTGVIGGERVSCSDRLR